MERTVITQRDVGASRSETRSRRPGTATAAWDEGEPSPAGGGNKPDDYKDRLFKYIPADVIALYLTLDGIIATTAPDPAVPLETLQWVVFGMVAVLTPLYLRRVAKVKKTKQIVISTLSFIVWAFYLGGPFKALDFYHPIYGALVFVVFTFAVPIWEVES